MLFESSLLPQFQFISEERELGLDSLLILALRAVKSESSALK